MPHFPQEHILSWGAILNMTNMYFYFVLEPRVGFERLFPSDSKLAKESRYIKKGSHTIPLGTFCIPYSLMPYYLISPGVRSCATNESGSAGAKGAIQFIRM